MKTQIRYMTHDGTEGITIVTGTIATPLEAKHQLARRLDTQSPDTTGKHEDVDERLRRAGVDPASITTVRITE